MGEEVSRSLGPASALIGLRTKRLRNIKQKLWSWASKMETNRCPAGLSRRHRHLIRRIHGLSGDGHEGLTTTVMLEDGDGDDAFALSIFRKSPRQSCPRMLLEPWPIVDQRYPRRPQRRENG